MKFSIKKKFLLQAINEASHAISPRSAVIPILTGMKIDVYDTKIMLTGSNSDITIQSTIPQTIEEEPIITDIIPGSIILPIPHFSDIIRKLPGDLIHIHVEDNYKTVIRSGNSVFTLLGQSSEEYPQIVVNKNETDLTIETKKLKKLIKQTAFAVSTMETKPILTGVNMRITDGELRFIATDTHRLAQRSVQLNGDEIDQLSIVIPGKSLQELNKVLDDAEEVMQIAIMNNQVLFYTDRLSFISRLLSGTYPDTDRLIPATSKTSIHITTKDFIDTVERAALLASEEQNNVVHFVASGDNFVEISSNSPEIGNVVEKLEIIDHSGEEVKISFSSRYLLDTLKTIDADTVTIDFTGPMHPFIVKTPEDENILHLILPVRTF